MQSSDFRDYVKTLFPDLNVSTGIIDEGKEKTIFISRRTGAAGLFFYGDDQPTQKLPMTLNISYNGNYSESEKATDDIYRALVYKNEVEYKNFVFSVFPKNDMLPVYLKKADSGIYQFAMDIDCYFNN